MTTIAIVRARFVTIDDSQRTFRVVKWKKNFVQTGIALRIVQPIDELFRCDIIFSATQLIEQCGDVRSRTNFMVEITKFLKGKVTWIDLIVLQKKTDRSHLNETAIVAYFSTGQTQFFQNFEYPFFGPTRCERFTNAKRKKNVASAR